MENVNVSIQIVGYNSLSSLFKLLELIFSNLVDSKVKFEVNLINKDSDKLMQKIKEKFPSFFMFVYVYKYNYDLNDFSSAQKFLAEKAHGKFLLFFSPSVFSKIEENKKRYLFKRIIYNPNFQVYTGSNTSMKIVKILKNNFIYGFKNYSVATFITGMFIFIEKESFNKMGGFSNFNYSNKMIEFFSKSLEYQVVYSSLPKKMETINFLFSVREKIFPEYKFLLFPQKETFHSLKENVDEIYANEWRRIHDNKVN